MQQVQITAMGIRKHLSKTNVEQAIAEYIWNGFDARATAVDVTAIANAWGGVEQLSIVDNGYGIDYDELGAKFVPYLVSEKTTGSENQHLTSAVHGKNGVGRLTFFAFAHEATWTTVYARHGRRYKYSISIYADTLNTLSSSVPVETTEPTGTSVVFAGVHTLTDGNFEGNIREYLQREFAWYLELNRSKQYLVTINGAGLSTGLYWTIQQLLVIPKRSTLKLTMSCLKLSTSVGPLASTENILGITLSTHKMLSSTSGPPP
jgi:hypothetical protein